MTDLAPLLQPLEEAIKVSGRLLKPYHKLKVKSVIDLLNHFPRSYSTRVQIKDLLAGTNASIVGTVKSCQNKATSRRRLKLTELVIEDGTGEVKAVFFNQPWLVNKLQVGLKVQISGPVDYAYGGWTMKPNAWKLNPGDLTAGMEADYPRSEGLENQAISHSVHQVLKHAQLIPDPLPTDLAAKLRLMPVADAYIQAHKPTSNGALTAARLALKYREFFLLQCGLRMRQTSEAKDNELTIEIDDGLRERATKYFPFEMTEAQKRVCREIEADMGSAGRMHRLLQGDVGSGKTAVALYAALLMIEHGYQVALLAPTEVLARQHFFNLREYLKDTKVRVDLLLGGMKKSERDPLLLDVSSGVTHILIGTHAMFEPYLKFKNLGLCIIDEQHKFGVGQRAKLRSKGNRPHVLAMSATPIPRTLSMTIYGAMEASVIDELPPGRTPVITDWVHRKREDAAYEKIRKEIKNGGRAYFVLPLVDESEKLQLKSAIKFAEELDEKIYPEFKVGLVHGQMSAEDKDRAVSAFRSGEVQILAATVVVEVGVDVPEANIMVIENAERFGLSQLHQLRGRVGRGRKQSYLYLFGEPKTEDSVKRLEVICRTTDGFEIAEEDLKMRGFGDFAGTRQSGLPKLHIGDFEADFLALERARRDVAVWYEKTDKELIKTCIDLHFGRDSRLLDV
ncbi:MAG: ATP-dependent DNA helicase RecG [Planctomycetes bacterium]|nr:ATP-dependent DNA helicase RecG [Planctomycetota bacterium]